MTVKPDVLGNGFRHSEVYNAASLMVVSVL